MAPTVFVKRDWWYGNDNGSAWSDYGRWVLLAVIIVVLVIMFLMVQGLSCRRARHGQTPITGTGWLVPPSYYQAQQQQNQEDAVPMYKQEAGQGDAGHFDQHGNFIPYSGPAYAPSNPNYSSAGPSGLHNSGENYAPPSMPPPSHTMPAPNFDDVPPPPGPPPSASSAAAAYYPPSSDIAAPAPARKN